jgi:glycosyltransferase involved in cell wall biosynthesis
MRVLLTSNASYDPPRGGSTRSNLAWLRYLAARGHDCHVVAPTAEGAADRISHQPGLIIHGIKDLSFHTSRLGDLIRELQPDRVLVSSEDLSHMLLREAGATAPGRIVYLAHTPQFFPFGPESWYKDASASEIIRQAGAVIAIGEHMAGYILSHLGRSAAVIHPPIYGEPPYPRFGRFGSGSVLMVNPCEVKGLSIFLALAARFPGVEFAALNGWGTTTADRAALARLPNTSLLKNVPHIDEVLSSAAILLMPSLWYEGFGLIAMEAMLRGLPVIASDSGGLLEAKRGTGYVVAVRPVERYEPTFDEALMPKAVYPEQDLSGWESALTTLLTNEEEYWAEAERSREAAVRFVSGIRASAFEDLLLGLTPAHGPTLPSRKQAGLEEALRGLDPQKRALLLSRLRHRKDQP